MKYPRWMITKDYKDQEDKTAKKYKGKKQAGSGAFSGYKEDVRTNKLLIQDKFTSKKSISIKLEDLKNLVKHAIDTEKIPVMRITFKNYPINFLIIIEEE